MSEDNSSEALSTSNNINSNGASHVYFEVGDDLKEKTDTLANVVMVNDSPSTIIFCNSFADSDIVELVLQKRGVEATKLGRELSSAQKQHLAKALQNEDHLVVITTDRSSD